MKQPSLTGLQKAKGLLKEKNVNFVMFQRDTLVMTSLHRGIIPLMLAIRDYPTEMKGAAAADKVIGKAGALLVLFGQLGSIYADVLSCKGKVLLDKYQINYQFGQCVDRIENRGKNGPCPMERLTEDIDNPQIAYQRIFDYYQNIFDIDLSTLNPR